MLILFNFFARCAEIFYQIKVAATVATHRL
jgi:hypothetical protein